MKMLDRLPHIPDPNPPLSRPSNQKWQKELYSRIESPGTLAISLTRQEVLDLIVALQD